MKEVYRIKKGKLITENHEVPFDFGLIFEEDGVFLFDFYVPEDFDLKTFNLKQKDILLRQYFSMTALTEDNNEVLATRLSATRVIPYQSKISMTSYGHLLYTDVSGYFEEKHKEERKVLYYIELEGLKMKFSDLTQTIKARKGVKVQDLNSWDRDHTNALVLYDGNGRGPNSFNFTFFENEENENIVVALPTSQEPGTNILSYDKFNEFKDDFIFLLSFLNGAEVKIRREYTGGYHQLGVVNSQTVITYSHKIIKNERHSDYVPINDSFYKGTNILNHVFIKCFNRYVTENRKLDLNSIIFYLNGAEQSNRIEEKFFIQIIALERLAQKYIESINEPDTFIVSDEIFKPVKEKLLKILAAHSNILGDKLNQLLSKVGEIHKIKRTSTEYKFKKLLEYAKIGVTPDIQNIIDEVRHKSIHHGDIGRGDQGIRNYLVLDQLLRDIILNIIGYDQARISRLN